MAWRRQWSGPVETASRNPGRKYSAGRGISSCFPGPEQARAAPALYDALLKRRNEAWAEALAAEMDKPGVELVAVGALHMAGADGLPALMAARGFQVRRVQ